VSAKRKELTIGFEVLLRKGTYSFLFGNHRWELKVLKIFSARNRRGEKR
jgi:hypothetical protein